jgi:hypothetical protein
MGVLSSSLVMVLVNVLYALAAIRNKPMFAIAMNISDVPTTISNIISFVVKRCLDIQ